MILLCSRWMLLPVFATPKVWKRCNSKMSLSTSWWTPWMFFWSDSFCVFLEIDDIYRKPLPKDVFDGNSIQQQLFFHLSHRSLQVFQLPPHVAIPSPPLSQHTKKGFFPPIPGKGPIPSLKKLPQLRDPKKSTRRFRRWRTTSAKMRWTEKMIPGFRIGTLMSQNT